MQATFLPATRLPTAQRWLKQAAAPRWTVLFFLLTAAASLVIVEGWVAPTPVMLAPFVLLVVNLVAAILSSARFRADLPLLVFHLALLVLVALVAFARLTYFDGRATLSRGTVFEGAMEREERGPLHWGRLAALRFSNEGVVARYSPQGHYTGTFNRVRWQDSDGQWHRAEIGDDRPLIIEGYRIYATVHRGLAPLFRWEPVKGEAEMGSVQLEDHRSADLPPSVAWQLPGGPEVWVQLDFTPLPKPAGGQQEDLGAANLEHALIMRAAGERRVVRAGDTVEFPEGRLTYLRLDSWMSYRFVYDPTIPWIIATVLVGVASLVWFYAVRVWSKPLSEDDE